MKLLKRLTALSLAFVSAALIGSWTQPMELDAIGDIPDNGERTLQYYVYDAQTALRLTDRTYTLIPPTTQSLPRSVIGTDTRVVDHTKTGVVKLIYLDDDDKSIIGTGFIVDDHTIATAGHCLYGHRMDQVLLFDTNGNVTLSATPVEYHIPSQCSESGTPYTWYNDYALLTVEEDLSTYPHFNLGVTLDTAITNQTPVSVTGFPERLDSNGDGMMTSNDTIVNDCQNTHNMYTGSGTLLDGNDSMECSVYRLKYNADTSDGNSGSPVYITTTFNGETYYTALAIHTHPSNSGVRINRDLLYFYLANPNIQF